MYRYSARWIVPALALVAALTLTLAPVFSQPQTGDACTALALRALEEVGQSCATLDRNSACYGFNRVGATFIQEVPEDIFSQPADRTGIETLESIQTSPLDEALQTWGIAVMKLQANIPNTLPGQNVVFILLGDTQVQNAVAPEAAAAPSDVVVDVQTIVRARLRSQPSLRANVLAVADPGQTLPADAVDETDGWLRVLVDELPGWMSRDVLAPVDSAALPVVTDETRAPMQAFYLTTGLGDPTCNEAPSMLVVQGPQRVTVDLTVNEARIQLSSTIILRLINSRTMEIIVLDGQAVVNNLVVPAGFKATVPVFVPGLSDEPDDDPEATPEPPGLSSLFPTITGPWEGCQPLSDEERQALGTLQNLPLSILNYAVTLPGPPTAQCLPPGAPPAPPSGPPVPPVVSGVDCSRLRPTSPLGGAGFGLETFYWDPAPGATAYRVNLFRADGSLAGSFDVPGTLTNLVIDTSVARGSFSFSWNVQALVNGQVACTSPAVSMGLAAPPPEPTIAPTPEPAETPEWWGE